MPSILQQGLGFLKSGAGFFGNKIGGLGGRIRGGIFQVGDKIFGGGASQGKRLFQSATDHFMGQVLDKASYYGKKFANSDFVRNRAATVVPELENASDFFINKLRQGYYGYDGNGGGGGPSDASGDSIMK